MSQRKIQFGQYESPNIVIVPPPYKSHDINKPSTEGQTIVPCNLPCCGIFAAQRNGGTNINMQPNNLTYYNTVPDNPFNHDVTTTQPNNFYVNISPWVTQFGSVQNMGYDSQTNIPQLQPVPLYPCQDYLYTNINTMQETCTCNCKNKNMYPYSEYTNSGETYQQMNHGNCVQIEQKEKVSFTNKSNLRKPDSGYDEDKEKNEEIKSDNRIKSLWIRHCKTLKDKLKEDIKKSEDIKTELNSKWQEILQSEYKTFVKNFYRSACVKRNKKSESLKTDKSKKSTVRKKSTIDLKNKPPVLKRTTTNKNINHDTEPNHDDRKLKTNSIDNKRKSKHSNSNINQKTDTNHDDKMIKRKSIDNKSSAKHSNSSINQTDPNHDDKKLKRNSIDNKSSAKHSNSNINHKTDPNDDDKKLKQNSIDNKSSAIQSNSNFSHNTDPNYDDRKLKTNLIDNKSTAKHSNSIKSVVHAPDTASWRNNHIKSRNNNIDLRTILRLKQPNNLCHASLRTAQKRPIDKENLIITINQDTKTDNKIEEATEPKPKKRCKKIKLVINVLSEGSDVDSDNSANDLSPLLNPSDNNANDQSPLLNLSDNNDNDQSPLLNPDLSFLDDFNVDDIVDSLNCSNCPNEVKLSTKETCADVNFISNELHSNIHIDESKDKGLNLEYLNVNSEKSIIPEQCDEILNGSSDFYFGSSANINTIKMENSTALLTETQTTSNELFSNVNLNTKKISIDSNDKTRILTETVVDSDKGLPKENTNKVINCEDNTKILPTDLKKVEDSFINNKLIEKLFIEETGETGTTDNNSSDESNTKSEGATKSTTNILSDVQKSSINIKTTADKEPSEKVTNVIDLIQIKEENEVIVISDTEDGDETSITNIENSQDIEIVTYNNNNSDTILLVETDTLSKSTRENTSKDLKKSITIDDNGYQQDNMKKQDSKSLSESTPTATKEVINIDSKNKADVDKSKIKMDNKNKTSVIKRISNASNSKPNKREVKDKQGNTKLLNGTAAELLPQLETYMFDFLNVRYNISSTLHNGKFSHILKCSNAKNENYIVKVLKDGAARATKHSLFMDKLLMKQQNYTELQKHNIVHIINSFKFMGYWCFIMEYYPKNLEQALRQNKKCLHINLVQILARQLVAAVTVLFQNNIVHTDIAPRHIFLNNTNEKLKLGGFDELNHLKYLNINPSTGTPSYRAPELILGVTAGYGIDVWSTATVIFEIATGVKLFPGVYNNEILFRQMCTLGKISFDMFQRSIFKKNYFKGIMFMRRTGHKGQNIQLIDYFKRNNRLHEIIFDKYQMDWESYSTIQEVYQDKSKLENLVILLEQMLTMDPRYRPSITIVGASEFINATFFSEI